MSGRAVRPSDFSYKHKAERTVNLVLAPLSDSVDEGIPDELRAALSASPTGMLCKFKVSCESLTRALGKLPITSLFSTFLYFHDAERLKKALQQILELLKSGVDKEPTVPDVSNPSEPFWRHFETLLYGDQELNRLRMNLCVADFCWVCSKCSKKRAGLLTFAFRNG